MLFAVVIGGSVLARRNLRLGRGDRRSAARLAIFVLALELVQWTLRAHHVATGTGELTMAIDGASVAALIAGVSWLFYLAIEPYVRRLWPQVLVSWVRLVDGRIRDPLVGRDVLFGLLAGLALTLLTQAWALASRWFGLPPPAFDIPPFWMEFENLSGFHFELANVLVIQVANFIFAASSMVSLVLLRVALRKQWLAIAGFVVLWSVLGLPPNVAPAIAISFAALSNILVLALFFRFGLLLLLVATFVAGLLTVFPLTPDLTRWYASNTVLVLIVVAALTAYAFRVALAGRPIFGDVGLER